MREAVAIAVPPHVILITCHDLGRHLGCYGVGGDPSPNIDALAAAGVRFERAFCTAPQCSPSRSSLATGRYPHQNGVMGLAHGGFAWELGEGERHVAGLLAASGYETHLFGVQHVTGHVERLGFAHVHDRRLAAAVAEDVAAVLRARRASAPLYLEMNLEQPHRPYDQGGARPEGAAELERPAWLPDGEATRQELAALRGAIRAADDGVGAILAAVEEAGMYEASLVLLTADHGLAMPRAKCTLYDPGLEVALLLRWPARVRGPCAAGGLVSNVDVLPTVLEAAGVPAPDGLAGRSLWPLVEDAGARGRDAVFAEKTFHSYYDPMRAIRTERFKLIRNFETALPVEVPADVQAGAIFRSAVERYSAGERPGLELYDLVSDPLEQRNLADDPALAEARGELDGRLWEWMAATGDPLLDGPVASPAYERALAQRPRRYPF